MGGEKIEEKEEEEKVDSVSFVRGLSVKKR